MDVLKALLARLSWRLVLYWGVLAFLLWGLAQLTDEVYEQEGFFFDVPVLTWFYLRLGAPLTEVMRVFSVIGDVPVMAALSLATAVALWFISRREALFFALSVGGASLFMALAKLVLARPRPELFPDLQLWETASASFPSGHATGSTAYFLSLYLVIARLTPGKRWLAALAGVVMVGMISASRLYLQVHYPSDILAGLALSALWVSGVNGFFRYRARDRSQRTVLLRLSSEVVERVKTEAEERGVLAEAVVNAALREHYGLEKPKSESSSQEKPLLASDI